MKLYHCADARSLRPLWALEELGADYELVNMAFPPRATYPGYLSINPLGTVPTFVDGDVTLTESTGICHYLGEKFAPTDLRVDPAERVMLAARFTSVLPPLPSRRPSV